MKIGTFGKNPEQFMRYAPDHREGGELIKLNADALTPLTRANYNRADFLAFRYATLGLRYTLRFKNGFLR